MFGQPNIRSFCFSPDKTNGVLHFLESTPILKSSTYSLIKMHPYIRMFFHCFLRGQIKKESFSKEPQ